jgi:hypothetical protein
LDGKVALDKPSLLSERGDLTIIDALAARNPLEHARLVEEWAHSVWKAYTDQHELARDWIRAAVETYRR